MLRYWKKEIYFPKLRRPKLQVSAEDQALARQEHPPALPQHCKPWVDGQTVGWEVAYGFLSPITIRGLGGGKFDVDGAQQLNAEAGQSTIDSFADGYLGLAISYWLQTPEGFASLILPPTSGPPGWAPLSAIVETDWYPRPIFLVNPIPPEGVEITLDFDQPLARVVVIPYAGNLRGGVEQMSQDEIEALNTLEETYLFEAINAGRLWESASGLKFSHQYKNWSGKHHRRLKGEDFEGKAGASLD